MEFRPLTDADLPMLHGWLNEPGVARWWEGDDVSWEGVVRDYGSQRTDAVEHFVAVQDGTDVGWIQCYTVADDVEDAEVAEWLRLGVDLTAAGIDYLIGHPDLRGGGLGTAMIEAFVSDVVFGRHPDWTQVCASPYEANVASWRALEAAGFAHRGTFRDDEGPCRLMVRDRR